MKTNHWTALVMASASVLTLSIVTTLDGCSSSSSSPGTVAACSAGQQVACTCSGGQSGIQVCSASGAYGACQNCTTEAGPFNNDSGGFPDTSVGGDTGVVDTGTVDAPSDGSTGEGSTGESGTDAGVGDAGGDSAVSCGTLPTLHPGVDGGGVYCPFGPDGGSIYCGTNGSADPICCISGEVGASFPPSTCAATAAACNFQADAGDTTIQCEDPATDCPSGQVCCGVAEGNMTPSPFSTCGYDKLVDWESSKCKTTCAAGEFEICATQSECPGGSTCTPFKAKGTDLGWCVNADGGAAQ